MLYAFIYAAIVVAIIVVGVVVMYNDRYRYYRGEEYETLIFCALIFPISAILIAAWYGGGLFVLLVEYVGDLIAKKV